MKSQTAHNLLVRIAPFVVAWLLRLCFSTCSIREYGTDFKMKALAADKSVIAAFWHYSLFYVFYHLRKYSAVALVSASKDGEYISRLAHHFNFTTIRGSRNRRGVRALKELSDSLKKGHHAGIVADGSQGPALIAQPGAIFLASRTGATILPIAWSASRYITIRSWDRTVMPMPFATISFIYGEQMTVPAGIDTDGIETHRIEFERRLNELYRQAWSLQGKDKHWDEIQAA
jgi:lysophospholipid acyltransferase (LPLAT)-like uncharacterized protein